MKKSLLTVLFILAILAGQAQEMWNIADSIRKRRFVPSLSYAVITADSIIEMAAIGYKKIRTHDTITLTSRYHLGGNTTAFTSFIAAQLVLKGKIKWNTKLADLFSDIIKPARPAYQNVTLADVLAQSTGLPSYNSVFEIKNMPVLKGKSGTEQRVDFLKWILQRKNAADSAGRKPVKYTNAGSIVAAAMLEKASGKSYEQLMDEYVNKPLGINVKYGFPNKSDVKDTWGHAQISGKFQGTPPNDWWGLIITPGLQPIDANISVADYAKFAMDNLRGLTGKKATMPQRSYELLHYAYPDYSMGWGNLEVNGNHISESDGSLTTFFAHIEIHKDKNLAVIVLCNSGDNAAKAASLNLARALREHYMK